MARRAKNNENVKRENGMENAEYEMQNEITFRIHPFIASMREE